MFGVTLNGVPKTQDWLSGVPANVRAALERKSQVLAINLQAHVVTQKLNGQVLNQRSGNLARSIQEEAPITNGNVIGGRVYSSGDVKYAAIHEYGGTIKHPGGTAYIPGLGSNGGPQFISNAAAAALEAIGRVVPRTQPHDIPMPERSFLRSSLADMSETITKGMKDAVTEGLKRP